MPVIIHLSEGKHFFISLLIQDTVYLKKMLHLLSILLTFQLLTIFKTS